MLRLSSFIIVLLMPVFVLAQSPHGAGLKIRCDVCHTQEGWKFNPANNKFDHSKTLFALTGQHNSVNCRQCHKDLNFSNAKTSCNACHKDVHQQTVGQECQRCHTPETWIVKNITEIHRISRFPLQGQHALVDCYQCHSSASLLRFDPLGVECKDCHANTYITTTNPSHVSAKFPLDCFLCHTDKGWQPAKFDHNTNTGFPLKNGHAGVECIKCHTNGYSSVAKECISCHQKDFNAAMNPPHVSAQLSSDCLKCHTDKTWKPAIFNHNISTQFPLKGGHINVECIKCHSKGYLNTPTTCVSCHQSNFNASINPSHVAAKFPTDCIKCHTETAWKPSSYNHNTATTFPLKGRHIGVDCIKCHTTGFAGIPVTCISCHQKDYNSVVNPPHLSGKFPTDCLKCHTESAWKPSSFLHNTSTAFPLTGGHVGVECIKCHSTGYTGTSRDCYSCHSSNYKATTNPSHATSKFSTDCATCHNMKAWKPATFNHNTNTTFPLTGGHIGVDCLKCHTNGYVGTTKICSGCHLNTYNTTTNPSHITAKFPTDCPVCHTVTAWKPSTFNHNTSTTFPLTGGHMGVDCLKCHATGYVGTTKICSGCHLNTFNTTTNPSHLAAKFSTDCTKCHTVNAWKPSTFNHTTGTTFPLTGRHVGVDCIKCHATGYVGTTKLCSGCHMPNYNKTTNPAHLAAKFPTTCESCHNMTAWIPSTYNHDSQYFKIYSGKHRGEWTLCTECHTNATNYKVFSCINCHEHNKTSMDSEHKGKSGYVYNSTNCLSCHPKV